MLTDHLGEFEAVQLRHADIDQDDGDFRFQQIGQGLLGRGYCDEIFVQLGQHDFIAQQLARLVIHQQHVDAIFAGCGGLHRWSHMRNVERSCSVLTGLAR
jgi:hypothetical protein